MRSLLWRKKMNGCRSSDLHVVVFPWLAYGHLSPYLELAKLLSSCGVRVSFLSTPANLAHLPPVPPPLAGSLRFVQLPPLPPTRGLPDGAEVTTDLPADQIPFLKQAFDGLRQPFQELLIGMGKVDLVIFDFVQYWAAEAATKLQIKCILLNIFGASFVGYTCSPSRVELGLVTSHHLQSPPPGFPPSPSLYFHPFEARSFACAFEGDISGGTRKAESECVSPSDMDRFHRSLRSCDAYGIRTCPELEGPYLRYLEESFRKKVIPVGVLPPSPPPPLPLDHDSRWCTWLRRRFTAPPVYVSFGSECVLSREQIQELALGLELSGLPFFWALRTPKSLLAKGQNLMSHLPDGMLERAADRGVVYDGWVPQQQILAHPAVRGFVSHSGWSSIIESLTFGKVLIHLPMQVDQGLVARLIAGEKKASVEVERDPHDGSFSRQGVCKAVRLALVDEEGEGVRKRAAELRDAVFGDPAVQEKCTEALLGFVKSVTTEQERGMDAETDSLKNSTD